MAAPPESSRRHHPCKLSQALREVPLGARASRPLEIPWACGPLRAGRPRSQETKPAPFVRLMPCWSDCWSEAKPRWSSPCIGPEVSPAGWFGL